MSEIYEIVKTLGELQQQVNELVQPEIPIALVSPIMALPGIRGAWPLSSFDDVGDAYDVSGQGRTLTNNNAVGYGYEGVIPYALFSDGAPPEYLSRADEPGLDVSGAEAVVVPGAKGMTVGGLFYFESLGADEQYCIAKYVATDNGSWRIKIDNAASVVRGWVTNTGVNYSCGLGLTLTTQTWNFIVLRFTPSTEIKLWVNTLTQKDTTGIPANIDGSACAFTIGADGVGDYGLDGRASHAFYSACSLSDTIIEAMYYALRGIGLSL